jgi:phage head maturation protease
MEKPKMSKIHSRSESEIQSDPVILLDARFAPASLNVDERTVETVFATERKVLRTPWFDEPYYEVLSMDPKHIRQERIQKGIPVLDNHDRFSGVTKQLGRAEGLVFGADVTTKMRFSRRAEAMEVFQDVADGIIDKTSVAYRVYKYEDITENDDKIKTYRAIDWEPFEISLVSVPADIDAQIRSASNKQPQFILEEKNLKNTSEDLQMSEQTKIDPIETEKRNAEIKAANDAGAARVLEIQDLCRSHQMSEEFTKKASTVASMDDVRKLILDEKVKTDGERAVNNNTVAIVGEDQSVKVRAASIESALLHRFDSRTYKLEHDARKYVNSSLVDLARMFAGNTEGMSKDDIAKRALATSDFPLILSNIANKTLRSSYDYNTDSFRPFVREKFVADFKSINSLQLSSGAPLEQVNEKGEFKNGVLNESGETYKVKSYGRIISITRQAIINDDLDALTKVPMLLGKSAADLEANLVYALLKSYKMADGKNLFHADHANLAAATTLDETALSVLRKLFRNQKDIGGMPLNIALKYLIVGPELETIAEQLLSTLVLPAKSSDVNVFRGKVEPIVDPRITDKSFYGAADPAMIDTIEIAYLEGQRGPKTETKYGFEVDGVQIKVTHDVGVGAIDHRGLVKNPGL